MMSSISSIPTEKRTNPSANPIFSRSDLGIEACVIDAGWSTKDSTPPRLSAKLKI